MNRKENYILLRDNRKLAYAEYGAENGYPIIYCHGSQSSRLEMHYDVTFATKNRLRIITIDRPGHGLSDYNSNGSILTFGQDVMELLDALALAQVSIAGMSAGAPFALGVAYSFPKRINKVAIISGFAPFNSESKKFLSKEVKTMLGLAKSVPFLLKILLKIQSKQLKKNPQKALKGFLKIMSEPDQEILKNPQVIGIIEEMFKEAFRKGSSGVAHEISRLLVKDWGFELNQIKTPVHFWQGTMDNNVPHQWAALMKNEIDNAELTTFEGEGHLIIFKHATEIFSDLKM